MKFLRLVAILSAAVSLTACGGNFKSQSFSPDGGDLGSSSAAFSSAVKSLWSNDSYSLAQFSVTMDVVPTLSNGDLVIGLSQSAPAGYADLATVIRFGTSGLIDVRNGSSYSANSSVAYSGGQSYHLIMNVNVATHTYSVSVTPHGG